jgi:hypothetical protein
LIALTCWARSGQVTGYQPKKEGKREKGRKIEKKEDNLEVTHMDPKKIKMKRSSTNK